METPSAWLLRIKGSSTQSWAALAQAAVPPPVSILPMEISEEIWIKELTLIHAHPSGSKMGTGRAQEPWLLPTILKSLLPTAHEPPCAQPAHVFWESSVNTLLTGSMVPYPVQQTRSGIRVLLNFCHLSHLLATVKAGCSTEADTEASVFPICSRTGPA